MQIYTECPRIDGTNEKGMILMEKINKKCRLKLFLEVLFIKNFKHSLDTRTFNIIVIFSMI